MTKWYTGYSKDKWHSKCSVLGCFLSLTCAVCLCLALYEKAEIKAPEDKNKHLLIGVSSDRGLCGAIHTSVAKAMKAEVANLTAAGKEVMLVNIGDKLRGLLYKYVLNMYLLTHTHTHFHFC